MPSEHTLTPADLVLTADRAALRATLLRARAAAEAAGDDAWADASAYSAGLDARRVLTVDTVLALLDALDEAERERNHLRRYLDLEARRTGTDADDPLLEEMDELWIEMPPEDRRLLDRLPLDRLPLYTGTRAAAVARLRHAQAALHDLGRAMGLLDADGGDDD